MPLRPLTIFLSHTSNIKKEKKVIYDVIQELDLSNHEVRDILKYSLNIIDWQYTHLSGKSEQEIQDLLNKQINRSNVFISLVDFNNSDNMDIHNFESEITYALDRKRKTNDILILPYFKKSSIINDNEKKIKASLKESGTIHWDYRNLNELRAKFISDLLRWLIRFRYSAIKISKLSQFWSFGSTEKSHQIMASVIYPSVDREYINVTENSWQRRLMPYVVFEDFKCIQKIEKTLRIINFNSYYLYDTKCFVEQEVTENNCIWICIPRNQIALNKIKTMYRDIAKFKFENNTIKWNEITINSPLNRYLELQRKNDGSEEWCFDLSNVVAKDYAVIARFNNKKISRDEGYPFPKVKDFFIAGIRGLGTWGAGWYIDRRYENFLSFGENENIQFLLEVIYKNGKIHEVVDVSHQPQKYFDDENKTDNILEHIQNIKLST